MGSGVAYGKRYTLPTISVINFSIVDGMIVFELNYEKFIVSLLTGSLQLYAAEQNVVIGLDITRKTTNEGNGPLKLCAWARQNSINEYSKQISVIYEDRSAVGKISLNITNAYYFVC